MNRIEIESVVGQVQRNCHIADARHGSDYGMCTYLLKMREYFRWERGLGFSDYLPKDEVGEWLSEREALWESLKDADFSPIMIAEQAFDPFDVEAINAELNAAGYIYSGGLGAAGRPHFFLAEMLQDERTQMEGVLVSGRELARDLAAPPAMNRGRLIFVRWESLRRMLWEKLEGWRWSRSDNALGRAFACYDFEQDLERALDAMTRDELSLVLLHERGERLAGEMLGEAWNRMLLDLAFTPAELMARAVRDHLADALVTLPALQDMGRPSSIHFYMGNLNGMRRSLFPQIQEAYEQWRESGDTALFRELALAGVERWRRLADAMLELHRIHGDSAADPIRVMVQDETGQGDPRPACVS